MAEYTDEEIKKALELCSDWRNNNCDKCPFHEDCLVIPLFPHTQALDLINRQEAEIEKLKEKNRLANQCTPKAIRRAKSEAIKEFAERLKENASAYPYYQYGIEPAVSVYKIDNLVKEMVGESNV